MKKYLFKDVRFIKTAVASSGYPKLNDGRGLMPEVAVAGRSNVGKSTLLNHLFNHKNMVKTSSTPGKTQALNFFTVNEELAFCDLPGYGYAKVPDSVRKKWGPMIQDYLKNRKSLHLILFLVDIRRTPNDDDRQFLEWAIAEDKAVLLVLTKCDKVRANEKKRNTEKILKALNVENLHHVHYSVPKKLGRQELIRLINEAIDDELEEE